MKVLLLTAIFVVCTFVQPFQVFAQAAPPTGSCTPGQGIDLADCLRLSDDTTVRDAVAYTSLSGLTNLVVSNLFVIAGVALFLYILFAGFIFATQGKAGAEKAKTIFTNSLAGFIIMISAYWIVQLIQYITGTNLPL